MNQALAIVPAVAFSFVKLPSYRRVMVEMSCVCLFAFFLVCFSLSFIFPWVAASMSHFFSLLLISRSSSLCRRPLQTSKFSRKKRTRLWQLSRNSSSYGCLSIALVVNVTFDNGLPVGSEQTYRRTDCHVITKISSIYRLPFFSYITHGSLAYPGSSLARESSAIETGHYMASWFLTHPRL